MVQTSPPRVMASGRERGGPRTMSHGKFTLSRQRRVSLLSLLRRRLLAQQPPGAEGHTSPVPSAGIRKTWQTAPVAPTGGASVCW